MSVPSGDQRQVPAYVALVRIGAVIGMSAMLAFALFFLVAAYWVQALVSFALALPFFAVMRLVERTVENREEPPPE